MIIDSHAHLGKFPLFNVELDIDGMVAIMEQQSIDKAVVFSLPNELTLKASERYPDKIFGLMWVNPHQGEEAVEQIREAIQKRGFRGVKLHPLLHSFLPDQEIVHPVMEVARDLRLPVFFHCGHPPWSLPWHFGNLADVYPDVFMILGHMGHGHIVYINGAIEVARAHENIILETSGMPMHSKVREAVEKLGEERVIYGSDMPFGHPAFELEKIRVAGLNHRQLDRVLALNSKDIFKL